MAFDPQALMSLEIPITRQTYDRRDSILYALGVGAGVDPLNEQQLAFVDETRDAVLPTMATVLGFRGFWVEQLPTGITAVRVLHGEQGLRVSAPLPASGSVRRETAVIGVLDKGPEKGAFVRVAETLIDDRTERLLATLTSTIICRAEGGHGDAGGHWAPAHVIPKRAGGGVLTFGGSTQQALIYRLSGDYNRLHFDPTAARAAGFERPILQGLATYGMACHALVNGLCAGDPLRVRSLDVRFTRPVYPGETLDLVYWIESAGLASFRVTARDRQVTALDNGRFEYAE